MSNAPAAPARRKHIRWIWLLLLLILVLAGGIAAWRLSSQFFSEYEATALLHFEWPPPRILPDAAPPPSGDSSLVMRDDYRHTQAALARSRLVLNAALRDPKVKNLPIFQDDTDELDWLEQHLRVQFADSPGIMEISLSSSTHTEDLQPLVNAIVKAYLDEIVNRDNIRQQERLTQLERVASTFEEKIRGIRKGLRELQQNLGPGNKNILAIRQETARLEYEQAKHELSQLHGGLRTLQLQLKASERAAAPETMVSAAEINAEIAKDPVMQRFEARRHELEEVIAQIREHAALDDKEPVLVDARARLEEVAANARTRRKRLGKTIEEIAQEHFKLVGKRAAAPETMVSAAKINAVIDKDPLMVEYARRAVQLEGIIEGIFMPDDQGHAAGKRPRDLDRYRELLRQVQEAADRRRKKLEVSEAKHLREAAQAEAQENQQSLKRKVDFLSELEKLTAAEVERLGAEKETVAGKNLELMDLKRELEQKEETLKTLNKEITRLRIELDAPPCVCRLQDAVLRKKRGK
jgi:hypothetical protein